MYYCYDNDAMKKCQYIMLIVLSCNDKVSASNVEVTAYDTDVSACNVEVFIYCIMYIKYHHIKL